MYFWLLLQIYTLLKISFLVKSHILVNIEMNKNLD